MPDARRRPPLLDRIRECKCVNRARARAEDRLSGPGGVWVRCAARRWLTANVFGCFERFLIGEETESDRLLHKRLARAP